MTPFCVRIHNIYTSYVGATYHVARNHMSQRQRATGGQCRRSVSTRPTRPIMSPAESAKMFRLCSDIRSDETWHVLSFRSVQGVPPQYPYRIYTVTQKGGKIRATSGHSRTNCARPYKACPLLSFVDLKGRKNTFDSKIMTPFCVPNHNIKTSYVGATYQVARFPATGQALWRTKRTQIPGPSSASDLGGGTPPRMYTLSILLPKKGAK